MKNRRIFALALLDVNVPETTIVVATVVVVLPRVTKDVPAVVTGANVRFTHRQVDTVMLPVPAAVVKVTLL